MAASPLMPGAEFLQRRLARATAIPLAQRPPDVAAFVESVQLLREVCDLLPLAADGSPALPLDEAAARQQMQLAFLKLARADYVCPWTPECDMEHGPHVSCYCNRWLSLTGPGASRSGLEAVLLLVAASQRSPGVDLATHAAALMASDVQRQAVGRQLDQLAAAGGQRQPLLSIGQLQYLCCRIAADAANDVYIGSALQQGAAQHGASLPAELGIDTEASSPARLEAVLEQGRTFAAQLLQLEPHNPKGYWAASSNAAWRGQWAEAVNLPLQAFRLAQQQQDSWGMMKIAQAAVRAAATACKFAQTSISRGTYEAVLAVQQQAQQAHRRCKHLLPQLWIEAVQPGGVQDCLEFLHSALQGQALQGQALQREHDPAGLQAALDSMVPHVKCDACGKRSAGLRRCSRCKTAQYCR